jgi:hypothetical protein
LNNFRIDIIKLNSRNYTSKLVWDKTFLANYITGTMQNQLEKKLNIFSLVFR